jgi:hypothetical protein
MYPTPDLSTITATRDAFEANVITLALFLSLNNLSSATAEYSGGGDSGQTDSIVFLDLAGADVDPPDAPLLPYVEHRPSTIWNNTPSSSEIKSYKASDFFSMLVDQALVVIDRDGYHNNEGGNGEFTVRANGTHELNHYDNVVQQEHTGDEGDFTEQVAAYVEAARKKLVEEANATCSSALEAHPGPYAVLV